MIVGKYLENKVYIDGSPLSTERSRQLKNHAPDGGVSWSYQGSGPSQFALALLLHFGATDNEAVTWYQELKREVIANIPQEDFTMEKNRIIEWLEARRIFAKELENNDKG